jgi:RND family efflux transporter MFP subunit
MQAGHVRSVLVLTALFASYGCQPPPPPQVVRPVRAIKVGDPTALTGRRFPGQAEATEEINLAFRVGGPLIALPVLVGDEVEAGQVIARIDPRDFEVHLRNIQAQHAEAVATHVLAADEYDRALIAHRDGAVSDIELSRRLANRDRAAANVDALQASVDAAKDGVDDTSLRVPFSGRVVARYVENFENVIAKRPIVRILDDSKIEMVVDIPEHLISLAQSVAGIRCTFDALPGVELPAEISEIGNEASATTRTFPVTLIMDQPEGASRVLPGMTGIATGRGVIDESGEDGKTGLAIPITAISTNAEGVSHVWIVDESTGIVSRRDVTVGPIMPQGVIVEGLEPGVWIAVAGVHYLREGQQVRIIDPDESDRS